MIFLKSAFRLINATTVATNVSITSKKYVSKCRFYHIFQASSFFVADHRGIHRFVAPTLRELKKRKQKLEQKHGKQAPQSRSGFLEWNYGAELFAFARRLNEEFDGELLRQALTLRSFTEQEVKKQQAVGIDEPVLPFKNNISLIEDGQQLLSNYVNAFLNYSYPLVPDDGIKVFHDFILSEEILAKVSSNIGTKQLILSADVTPTSSELTDTFKALVSALQKTTGDENAFLFVRDFVLTQLNQLDLNEVWQIENPLERLQAECKRLNLSEPEPRSLGDIAKTTILACSRVGLYCNKKLLSTGFGEDVRTAIEAAALNGLNKMFGISETQRPLNFNVTLAEIAGTFKDTQKTNRRI